jgi:cytoskeletal protein RodZ
VKKGQQVIEEEVQEEELSPRELKKQERQASAEKRKKARQKDKVARFAGIILLGMILLVGFLLWVAGEMQQERTTSTPQRMMVPSPTTQDVFRVR